MSGTLTVMEWDKKNGNLIIDRILFHLDYMSGTFILFHFSSPVIIWTQQGPFPSPVTYEHSRAYTVQ